MLNARTLFPPLFRPVDSGGGGVKEKIAEIDSQITDISGDITQIDSAITRLSNDVGDLSQLDTTDKSSLVGAVNEVAGSGGGFTIPFSTTPTEVGTYMDGKKVYMVSFSSVTMSSASVTLMTNTNINRVIGCFGTIKPAFGGDTHTIGTYAGANQWSSVVLGDGGVVKILIGSNYTGNVADITIMYVLN